MRFVRRWKTAVRLAITVPMDFRKLVRHCPAKAATATGMQLAMPGWKNSASGPMLIGPLGRIRL
jgi:hypothetical protein